MFHCEVEVGLCDLFVHAPSLGMRGHTCNLSLPRCKTDTKRFFNFRIINVWNSLPSEVAECSTLSGFKKRLDVALGERLFSVL